MPIRDQSVLNSFYLPPGIPEATRQIIARPDAVFDYTGKSNRVAIVTDGSAVLGLGNIGPRAALPVMEGKAILFQTFAGIEAYPICLATQKVMVFSCIVCVEGDPKWQHYPNAFETNIGNWYRVSSFCEQ